MQFALCLHIGEGNPKANRDKLRDDQFSLMLVPACQMGMVAIFMPFPIPETARLKSARLRGQSGVRPHHIPG